MTPEYVLKVLVNSCTAIIVDSNGISLPYSVIRNKGGNDRFYIYAGGYVTSNKIERITFEDMEGRLRTARQRTHLEQVKDKRLIKAIMAFVGREMLS